jgi:hypothetical protein
MPSWPGKYHHAPCDRCGYATRFKQFPLVCACTTPDRCPHPPISVQGDHCQRCGGDARVPRETMNGLAKYIEEIWAEQEQKNAALRRRVPTDVPPLRIAEQIRQKYAHNMKHQKHRDCAPERCRYGDGTCPTHSGGRTR